MRNHLSAVLPAWLTPVFALAITASLAGCPGGDTDSDTDTDGVSTEVCTDPTPVECLDEMILKLGLQDDKVSTGEVVTTTEGDSFVTTIDATAGGFGQSQNFPWTYIRFTATGAERVDIDDEAALESMDWHLAAKRFIVRLNGGSSGPSCVGAAPFLEKSYDELTSVPAGLRFSQDDYFTGDCTIVNDSSGLPDSPQVALAAWWEYPGCVKTTGVPFLVQLDDGSVIRLAVEQYYAQGQETCNTAETPGTGGANLKVRWSVVE
ncbi:MAG: HmuY family protein [Myxococcota bacterium]